MRTQTNILAPGSPRGTARDQLFLCRPSAMLSSIMLHGRSLNSGSPPLGDRIWRGRFASIGASGRCTSIGSHPGFEEHSMAHKTGGITGGERRNNVELFEEIRRGYAAGETIKRSARATEARAGTTQAGSGEGGDRPDAGTAEARCGHSQAFAGDISGVVTDATGAVIPNAKVTVTNTVNGGIHVTSASDLGSYRVSLLVPGSYTVSVTAPGFTTTTSTVLVAAGAVDRQPKPFRWTRRYCG